MTKTSFYWRCAAKNLVIIERSTEIRYVNVSNQRVVVVCENRLESRVRAFCANPAKLNNSPSHQNVKKNKYEIKFRDNSFLFCMLSFSPFSMIRKLFYLVCFCWHLLQDIYNTRTKERRKKIPFGIGACDAFLCTYAS